MEKRKADWQIELEKPGWRISKAFDKVTAQINAPSPWHENLRMTLGGMAVLAFAALIPVALIALFVAALR